MPVCLCFADKESEKLRISPHLYELNLFPFRIFNMQMGNDKKKF